MFNSFMGHARDTFDNITHGQNPFGGGGQNQNQQRQRQRGRSSTGASGGGGSGGSMPFPFHFGPGTAAGPPPPEPRQKTPPASTKAIRMLPTIRVAPEDLIDQNNRECCVCLECNQLDDRVIRLPCAHIFHAHCIVDWLANHSCTCPVCRYELPTDNPQYEVGRIERMKTRKPRYALHEMKRLSVQDLLALKNRNKNSNASSSNNNNSVVGLEKSELIQWLIDNDRVDVIPAPEPVRHELQKLQEMRIKDLRRTMEEAGVFFRKEDVVEKSDMLKIFLNSGRLELIVTEPIEEEDSYSKTSSSTAVAAASAERSTTIDDTSSSSSTFESKPSAAAAAAAAASTTASKIPTESNDDSKLPADTTTKTRTISKPVDSGIQIETVTEDDSDDEDNNDSTNRKRLKRPSETSPEFTPPVVMFPGLYDEDSSSERPSNETENINDTIDRGNGPAAAAAAATPAAAPAAGNTTANAQTQENQEADTSMDIDDHGSNNDGDDVIGASDSDSGTRRSTFEHYTVAQLQNLAEDAGVDISHALERKDIVLRLESVGLVGNNDNPDAMLSIKFDPWSISQLRAVASVADIDVSSCSGREEIIHNILFEINYVRPSLRDLVRAIPPFFDYTTSDLRGVARDLNVDISGCLEKDEIIYRLISRGFNRRS